MTGNAKGYNKRQETLIKKYGEEGYREKLKEWARKSRQNTTPYFQKLKQEGKVEELRQVSRHALSRRWGSLKDYPLEYEEITKRSQKRNKGLVK